MSPGWCIFAATAGLAGLWYGRDRAHALERLNAFLVPLLLVGVAYVAIETVQLSIRWVWSSPRLAPVIGLFHGYPLYSPIDSGPINGWIYGPIAALFWAPAALASSPEPALLVAATINLSLFFLPLGILAARATDTPLPVRILAFIAGAMLLLQLYPTWYMASALNVDAIAVSLGAGSCLVLTRANSPSMRDLSVAAILSALAVWTKQTEAPLPLVQALWLGAVAGWRSAAKYSLLVGAVLLAVPGLLLATGTSLETLVFNLWTIPAGHPRPGGWIAARDELIALAGYGGWLWLPLVAAFLLRSRQPQAFSSAFRSASGLLTLAALALLPLGILSTIKLGGDRNSLHSVYYLGAALVGAVASRWPTRAPVQSVALLFAAIAATALAAGQSTSYTTLPFLPARCLSQEAWRFAIDHPGQAYFPWDPLATLMAESRYYHFEYGVVDRHYAGHRPHTERIASDLAVAPRFVVYPKAEHSRLMLREYQTTYELTGSTEDWLIFQSAALP